MGLSEVIDSIQAAIDEPAPRMFMTIQNYHFETRESYVKYYVPDRNERTGQREERRLES